MQPKRLVQPERLVQPGRVVQPRTLMQPRRLLHEPSGREVAQPKMDGLEGMRMQDQEALQQLGCTSTSLAYRHSRLVRVDVQLLVIQRIATVQLYETCNFRRRPADRTHSLRTGVPVVCQCAHRYFA